MLKYLLFVVLAFAAGCTSFKALEQTEIKLEGEYKGHLQDVWYDGEFIYWAHTHDLLKTDGAGHIVASAKVNGHNAGLQVQDGVVYVAVCKMQSETKGKTLPDCFVTINEYDVNTLELLRSNVLPINDRSGSLAILDDGSFFVGCLRPQDITPSQVRFHHISRDYRLIKSYVLDVGEVKLGIEVIKNQPDGIYLFMYRGQDNCIKLDKQSFKEVWRGRLAGSTGIIFTPGGTFVSHTSRDPATKHFTSSLRLLK